MGSRMDGPEKAGGLSSSESQFFRSRFRNSRDWRAAVCQDSLKPSEPGFGAPRKEKIP